MARKRVEDNTPPLNGWDDVDKALAAIGECQREIEAAEHKMQAAVEEQKKLAEATAKPYHEKIAILEKQIKRFAELHRADFKGKTKVLNFGSTGFRKSTKVSLPKGTKLAEVIRLLKEKGMGACVSQPPPKVDKDALKKYSEADIIAVGASLKSEDAFWYEVDREKLTAK